jgi:hypothetical protein
MEMNVIDATMPRELVSYQAYLFIQINQMLREIIHIPSTIFMKSVEMAMQIQMDVLIVYELDENSLMV